MVLAAMLCSVVLLTLGLLVSMAVMAWYFYSPVELVAGPGCSRLVRANPLFVKEITVRMVEGGQGSGENGLVLYGHAGGPPRLDVPAAWSEARRVVVPANSHREWVYFLNRGSQIQVDYSVEPETAPPSNRLCVVVAQGKESFMQWSEKPSSVHGTTFSRRLVHAILAVVLLMLYEVLATMLGCCCCSSTGDGAAEQRTTTASLLAADKEEEDASLGSSYDSVSSDGDHDEEAGGDEEEGRRLCVVCCDARRDCFFLPCGHSATCHPCGTRIVEGDGGSCPFCRRKLKKVRRIFAV